MNKLMNTVIMMILVSVLMVGVTINIEALQDLFVMSAPVYTVVFIVVDFLISTLTQEFFYEMEA